MCIKQTLVERVHADRDRGWDNGSGVSWTEDIVPLVDAYDAAIAEVERLRSTNELLEQEARIRKNLCDGFASEAAEERAAVVAWLRTVQPGWPAGSGGHADAIERGEHRREEER